MVAKVAIGKGGRLYRDARDADDEKRNRAAAEVLDAAADVLNSTDGNAPDTEPVPPAPKPGPSPDEGIAPPKAPPWVVRPMMPDPEPEPAPPKDYRELRSTIIEVLGIIFVAAGFGLWHLWVGLVALGVLLIVFGMAEGIPPGEPSPFLRPRHEEGDRP